MAIFGRSKADRAAEKAAAAAASGSSTGAGSAHSTTGSVASTTGPGSPGGPAPAGSGMLRGPPGGVSSPPSQIGQQLQYAGPPGPPGPSVDAARIPQLGGIPPGVNDQPPASRPPNTVSTNIVYPWSQRRISMNPPSLLTAPANRNPNVPLSPNPFPRYGHAVNAMASASGEVYLFGGLVRESVKNDIYVLDTIGINNPNPVQGPGGMPVSAPNGLNATLLQTTGDIPPPRVGHKTVLVSNVLILWGGDTTVRPEDPQDEGLYLLNLSTREWTRVRVPGGSMESTPSAGGLAPVGRYGHTVSIVGSRFYVFGGQVNGTFLDDLWSFDLNTLKGKPTWELVKPASSDVPPKRTGHASVTYKDKILIFGGTDGQYHYNDTWCFDVPTNQWKELSCIGYIPVPREGHSACLVDDVMYVFGGRGVDGKDLGDLASFKISNQRWYMFANMGPSPSGRSGHSLAAINGKVVVLGGESYTGAKPDDPTLVHVLDTAKIKYPADNRSANRARQSSVPGAGASSPPVGSAGSPPNVSPPAIQRATSPVGDEMANQRAASPTHRQAGQPVNGLMSQVLQGPGSPPGQPGWNPQQQQQQQQVVGQQDGKAKRGTVGGPPQRPRREGDAAFETADPRFRQTVGEAESQSVLGPERSMSPTQGHIQAQRAAAQGLQQQLSQGAGVVPSGLPMRAMSPPIAGPGQPSLRSQRSIEAMQRGANGAGGVSPSQFSPTSNASSSQQLGRANGRSASPNDIVGAAAPADGFYYGARSPTATQNGFSSMASTANGVVAGAGSGPADVEALRKREAWLKAALAVAAMKGFVPPSNAPDGLHHFSGLSAAELLADRAGSNTNQAEDPMEAVRDVGTESGGEKRKVVEALMMLKGQLGQAKAVIARQAKGESDRVADAEKARTVALQEAAFYRAKVAALEAGSSADVSRLERERSSMIEGRLTDALNEVSFLERKVAELRGQTHTERELRKSAEERLAETTKRVRMAEEAQLKASGEYAELYSHHLGNESKLREHAAQITQLTSVNQQARAEHGHAKSQLEETKKSLDQHLVTLEQVQSALLAANSRASETERLYQRTKERLAEVEDANVQLTIEIESVKRTATSAQHRIVDLESLYEEHRKETESMRTAAMGGLADILAAKRESDANRGDPADAPHVVEKLRALEDESSSLRDLHAQARSAADEAHQSLADLKVKNADLEKQQAGLRSELAAMRSQLAISLQEVGRLKEAQAHADKEAKEKSRAVEAAEVKSSLLRNFMADRGITIPDDEQLSAKSGYADKRIRELENELDQRAKDLQDAESRVDEMGRELDHLRSKRSSRSNRASVDAEAVRSAEARAEAAEQQLNESTASYKERLAQLENDYQTAVQFVKGTEKMLRRMKDELTKYKKENANLQAEVTAAHQNRDRTLTGAEAASEAARDIEALRTRLTEISAQNDELTVENREMEKRVQTLMSERRALQDAHADLDDERSSSSRRVGDLEAEVKRLTSGLANSRQELQETLVLNEHLNTELSTALRGTGGSGRVKNPRTGQDGVERELILAQNNNEQLKSENATLSQRINELEEKFHLLLGKMETSHGGGVSEGHEVARDSMAYGSITSELDKWERDRLAGETDAYGLGGGSTGPGGEGDGSGSEYSHVQNEGWNVPALRTGGAAAEGLAAGTEGGGGEGVSASKA